MFRQRLRIAGRIGLVIAIMVSSVVTVMQWWDNPGDVFHSVDGTNWPFVWDTWLSWFSPTLLWSVGIALAFMAAMAGLASIRQPASAPVPRQDEKPPRSSSSD
ncbi:MAG: hypothetical protein O2797_05265 [Bacteroidetes bacterium]|nr:hypothetical protein [Bacteroidota bacterium]MDA1333609.1 hypothetical protein [Bacteroidota bacterium]